MDQGPEWFDEGWVRRFAGLDARLDLAEVDGLFMVPWGWDTHWVRLRQWLVYHIDQGHARLTTRAGAPQELSPGDLVCLPAGLEFRVTAQRPATTVRIRRFRFSRPDAHPMPLLVPGCSHVASLIDELIEECGLEAEPLHPERVAALLTALFTALLRCLRDSACRSLPAYLERQAWIWAGEHVCETVDPRALAAHLGLSHDYCTRLFRASFGCPPRQWLLRQRLKQIAIRLRETDQPLDALARDFGYQDQKLLGRQFQRCFGISPGRYRRRFRGL